MIWSLSTSESVIVTYPSDTLSFSRIQYGWLTTYKQILIAWWIEDIIYTSYIMLLKQLLTWPDTSDLGAYHQRERNHIQTADTREMTVIKKNSNQLIITPSSIFRL